MDHRAAKNMLYTARDAITGEWTSTRSEAVDARAGDLAYLDPARPHDIQIRPVLAQEQPRDAIGTYPPGAMWVVWTSPSGVQLRAIVALGPAHRKNIRSNVERALRKVAKHSPGHAALFHMAAAGLDPFAGSAGEAQ